MKKIIYHFIMVFAFLTIFSSLSFASNGIDITDRAGTEKTTVDVTDDDIVVVDTKKENKKEAWNRLYKTIQISIAGILGMGILASIGFILKNIFALTSASNNPTARQNAIMGMIYPGIALAVLGSSALFLQFGFNFFK